MLEKLQVRIAEVTSVRQYSFGPAAAGVVVATNASPNNAIAGTLVIFKSCFIFFTLYLSQPQIDMGCQGSSRHQRKKKAKEFSRGAYRKSKSAAQHAIIG